MNHELLAATTTAQETESAHASPAKAIPVEKVLAEISRDSRRDAQQYLDESVTPHGGE